MATSETEQIEVWFQCRRGSTNNSQTSDSIIALRQSLLTRQLRQENHQNDSSYHDNDHVVPKETLHTPLFYQGVTVVPDWIEQALWTCDPRWTLSTIYTIHSELRVAAA